MSAAVQPAQAGAKALTHTRALGVLRAMRVLGVILVIGAQTWVLQPMSDPAAIKPLDAIFRAGGPGVTVLLTCSGFAVAYTLQQATETGGWRRALEAARDHFLPLLAAVAAAIVAVLLIEAFDSTSQTPGSVTRTTIRHLLTSDLNSSILAQPFSIRGDLTAMWYFSVEVQLLAFTTIAMVLLRRRQRVLIALAAVLAVAGSVWRWHVMDTEGWFVAGLRTDTRADAWLYGVLAALLARRLRGSGASASSLTGAGVLTVPGFVIACSYLDVEDLYEGVSPALAAVVALSLAAAVHADGRGRVFDLVRSVVPRALGQVWTIPLALAGPVTYWVARRGVEWSGGTRLLSAVLILALVAVLADRARPLASTVLRRLEVAASESARQLRAAARVRRGGSERSTDQVGDEDRGSGSQ